MPGAYGKERKRGERFGRLGSCAQSVQADKIKKINCKNPWHFQKHGKKTSANERETPV